MPNSNGFSSPSMYKRKLMNRKCQRIMKEGCWRTTLGSSYSRVEPNGVLQRVLTKVFDELHIRGKYGNPMFYQTPKT